MPWAAYAQGGQVNRDGGEFISKKGGTASNFVEGSGSPLPEESLPGSH